MSNVGDVTPITPREIVYDYRIGSNAGCARNPEVGGQRSVWRRASSSGLTSDLRPLTSLPCMHADHGARISCFFRQQRAFKALT